LRPPTRSPRLKVRNQSSRAVYPALMPVNGLNGSFPLRRVRGAAARPLRDSGIQLISEIVSVPGAELLGPLPAELQAMNVISAGIVTTASEPDAARVLLKFLTSPAAAAVIKATGMEPGDS
jgi:molybdate transport system substrate-binding protein